MLNGNLLRYRGNKQNLLELAKNLDAFRKVPEKYTETTKIGGTLSLLSRLLILILVYQEIHHYYEDGKLRYQFQPDVESEKVPMHVDITVAMPCHSLMGVDLMDETQQDVFAYGTLQREGVWWTLSHEDRMEFEQIQHTNRFLRDQYHAVADILFKDIIHSTKVHEPEVKHLKRRRSLPEEKYDACRLYGTLGINKVAGVLHLVGGTRPVVDIMGGNLLIDFQRIPANFTHRINRLSFGQYGRSIVQPLEADEIFIQHQDTVIQYFLNIVPTEIHNTFSTLYTYQYSVTEHIRVLDPEKNSYGSPGIYFNYDWSALKIIVRPDRENLLHFVIRLCSIISGIIVISGILKSVLVGLVKCFHRESSPSYRSFSVMHPLMMPNNLHPTTTTTTTTTATTKTTLGPNPLLSTRQSLINNDLHYNSAKLTIFPIQNKDNDKVCKI